jgi:hypothetical protein
MLVSQGLRESAETAHKPTVQSAARAVLEKISELADRQRAAIVVRDVRTLNRLFESLLRLHTELGCLIMEQPAPARGLPDALNPLATRVRQQLRLNQQLIANGAAMTDHFMSLLGVSAEQGTSTSGSAEWPTPAGVSAALFSGVA